MSEKIKRLMEQFARNLTFLRKTANLSRKEIAEKLSMGEIAYGDFERGQRLPDINKLCILADLFKTTPNYLLGYDNTFMQAIDFWIKNKHQVNFNIIDATIELILPTPINKQTTLNGLISYVPSESKHIYFTDKQAFITFTLDTQNKYKSQVADLYLIESSNLYEKINNNQTSISVPFPNGYIPAESLQNP